MSDAAFTDFQWADPFLLEQQLTDEERMVRDSARGYCDDRLLPRITEAHRNEVFDRAIMSEMAPALHKFGY